MRNLKTNESKIQEQGKNKSRRLLFVGNNGKFFCENMVDLDYVGLSLENKEKALMWLRDIEKHGEELPDAILCDLDFPDGDAYTFFDFLKNNEKFSTIPFIITTHKADKAEKLRALKAGIDDFYILPFDAEDIHTRINFLKRYKQEKQNYSFKEDTPFNNNIPLIKRIFDILVASVVLIILSPLLLLIALLIKLESKGPVFYVSKRAGTGYQVFDFYKFRSMRQGADSELKNLLQHNQYAASGGSSFVKISNDPRVTVVGNFLRNTSLDELPQLINVLKGDMSIVGNRPLPLYEAEQLTTDMWAQRFLAPAGITGLWQVTKRGKKEMSEAERKQLDITYANGYSFWMDCKIIMRTFPALLQKESV
jgi:lipopolysaccharide/colanic/teichoic acid biosynthesis glycosyltransferase